MGYHPKAYNPNYKQKGITRDSQLWTKITKEILADQNQPISTFQLLTLFADRVWTERIYKVGSTTELLANPAHSMLVWMANNGLITQYGFSNRKTSHWGAKDKLCTSLVSTSPPQYDKDEEVPHAKDRSGTPPVIQSKSKYEVESEKPNTKTFNMTKLTEDIAKLQLTVESLKARIEDLEIEAGIELRAKKTVRAKKQPIKR